MFVDNGKDTCASCRHVRRVHDEGGCVANSDDAEPCDCVGFSENFISTVPLRTWRTGTKLGRTLYVNDRCVGMVDTPELAAELTTAANGSDELLRAIAVAADEYLNYQEDPDDTVSSGVEHMIKGKTLQELLVKWRAGGK